jgi:hypothetical protein
LRNRFVARALGLWSLPSVLWVERVTPEEKRERRQVKHQLQSEFRRIVNRRIGLYLTLKQVKAGSKILAERYLKEESERLLTQYQREAVAS